MLEKRFKYLFIFVFLSTLANAGPPAFDDLDDDFPPGCDEFLAAMGPHGELFRVLLGVNTRTVEDFWDSAQVQTYLQAQHSEKRHADPWEESPVLVAYLERTFGAYNKKAPFSKRRGASLAAAASVRGLTLPANKTRAAFEKASLKNKHGLLGDRRYVSTPQMQAAESIVARILPEFTHNTPRKTAAPQSHLVSSQQLEAMGFPGGLNTSAFNQWLKADDQVFFLTHLTRAEEPRPLRAFSQRQRAMQDAYGDAELLLDTTEAKAAGWVSAYVMDPDDLIEFGQARHPEFTGQLRAKVARLFGVSDQRARIVEEGIEKTGLTIENVWKPIAENRMVLGDFLFLRESLHALDFTVTDFTDLLQQQLLLELQRLQTAEPALFEKRLAQLARGDAHALGEALRELFYKPLRLPRDFELKVPVAVAPSSLRVGG